MWLSKRFILILCAIFFSIFIITYNKIQNANEKLEHDVNFIDKRLKQLEKGFYNHRAEVIQIREKFKTFEIEFKTENKNQEHVEFEQLQNETSPCRCRLQTDLEPNVKNQMLQLYDEIPFDNVNGGVWKQGWDIKYDEKQWTADRKLRVFVVPHSHNDPGWLKTFDEYYEGRTQHIFNNMLVQLFEHKDMKIIWAEICYFSRWYDNLGPSGRERIKLFIRRNQLEFVTGGWVMPDEANSHWYSLLQQLTEGQTWLKTNLNVTPSSSWAIDPFGYSPTMPYILKKSGLSNLLIQRTHYEIKKRLAREQELEFRWRQIWDRNDENELFTHMMPFASYDIGHTCGPDKVICNQYDFKMLPKYGFAFPWETLPQKITESNVKHKSEILLDQWRKKAVLYKSPSVLVPLGDDFRFIRRTEWEAQRTNYQKMFDYLNQQPDLNVEVKFTTLQDYFEAIHKEHEIEEYPTLSGDFFTYSDREDHYWSGYYTSRPYHKRMDRVLMNYLRSAEMLHAWSEWDVRSGLAAKLTEARRTHSLFQHHDGITGTAREHVVLDYAARMDAALADCKFVMQQAVHRLLTDSKSYQPYYKFVHFHMDDSRTPGPNENRITIEMDDYGSDKHVVIHNSMPYSRSEIVEFQINTPFVGVADAQENSVPCQVAPVWSWTRDKHSSFRAPELQKNKFRLLFKATAAPMGLQVYTISFIKRADERLNTLFSETTILSHKLLTINKDEYPLNIDVITSHDLSIRQPSGISATFNHNGLLESLSVKELGTTPVHLEFLKYGVRQGEDQSGAYLFLPDGQAVPMFLDNPVVVLTEGFLESSVAAGLPFALHETILRDGAANVEIRNVIDIGELQNTEIVMRLTTNIRNDDLFYTDLNGMQIIKRKRIAKIPLQAHYYPVPSSIFIEDRRTRLTVLTAQPLGGSSLAAGEIEIMQDRRLATNDGRGLGQGVQDNRPVQNIFKIILENRDSCKKNHDKYPGGFLTLASYKEMQSLLHPCEKFIYAKSSWLGMLPDFGANHQPLQPGVEVAVFRDIPHSRTDSQRKSTIGLVIHRTNYDECGNDVNADTNINIRNLLGFEDNRIIHSALPTMLRQIKKITTDEINICPFDIKGFIINR